MNPEDLLNTLDDLGQEEFVKFKWYLQHANNFDGRQTIKKSQLQSANRSDTVELMVQTYRLQGAVEVTRKVLQSISRNDLLVSLAANKAKSEDGIIPIPEAQSITFYQRGLQLNFQDKFMWAREGWAEDQPRLVDIYTELYITAGCDVHINTQHEIRQIERGRKQIETDKPVKLSDMFIHPSGEYRPIKTVLTNGIAGIGKTFLVQKFVLDWAEQRSNQDLHLLLPFTFRQLNSLKGEKLSLAELVHVCIPETLDIKEEALDHIFSTLQSSGNSNYDKSKFKLLFVFDGLDESRLQLNLHTDDVRPIDVTKPTTADVLLRNLISGRMLRSARIWITTRPAAANQLPKKFVSYTTEVRGFTDPQKDEYFRKRFRDEEQANRIITHIKTSRSLHIMCHIPIFCWITATVLEDVLKTRDVLPKTLTEMYTEFLGFQIDQTKEKYGSEKCIQCIKTLAKLSFHQLEKGELVFYEKDLRESGMDFKEASVCSGVFTEIFREERGRKERERMFSFVHLSVQEFLAAAHVRMSLINSNKNVMSLPKLSLNNLHLLLHKTSPTKIHMISIEKALQSPNGHLDLFVRFLLGLSLQTNQDRLIDLLEKSDTCPRTNQKTVKYIKEKLSENLSADRSINLFHCLNELNDSSLVEEIQQSLRSGNLSRELTGPQWSALAFILLTSEKDLDVFDLKKYSASEEAFLRLLPVVKASSKALLSSCNLSEKSCEALSSILCSQSFQLKELDLSENDLKDTGVKHLCVAMENPHCKLEILGLSGCMITEDGCAALTSALVSNPSHLRKLDLSYNHVGETEVKQLMAALEDPHWKLDTLRLEHGGKHRIQPGLKKYYCELTLDKNTANRSLKVSDDNREVTRTDEEEMYPHHPTRFETWKQILCTNTLTNRCYWEVEWKGWVYVGVAYSRIKRIGGSRDCWLGWNDHSWSLRCSDEGYYVWHNNERIEISSSTSSVSHKVAVYVDHPAGLLTFYEVTSDTLVHLHTFNTEFTHPLFAGFRLFTNSSVVFLPSLR